MLIYVIWLIRHHRAVAFEQLEGGVGRAFIEAKREDEK